MFKIAIITVTIALFSGCFSSDEVKKVDDTVQPEKSEPAKKAEPSVSSETQLATKKSEIVDLEVMNAPGSDKSAPMTKELPTEVIAAKEVDSLMTVDNPVSKPQVFIVRNGEVIPETESIEQPEELSSVPTAAAQGEENDQIKDFIVAATHLNVRSGPSMNFPVVRVVKSGAKFRSLSIEGIWVQMAKNEYVSLHFLKEDNEEYAGYK